MLKKKIIISNKLGLHARAAAKLVEHSSKYLCEVWIIKGNKKVNAKSIMGIMMLAGSKGHTVEILTDGKDEKHALADISKLFENNFGEGE